MKRPVMVAAIAGLAACTTPAEPERTARYECDHGQSLNVTFHGDMATVVPDGGDPIVLPQAPAGSGFLYQTPTHSLRGKGNEAIWTVGRMVPINCKAA